MNENSTRSRLLVVDDQEEMALGLADYLSDHGYSVKTATSGEGALALLETSLVDAVITDLRMQGVDGFDLLDAIRRHDALIPVFIMTAFGTIDSAVAAVKRGAYHYFSKPLNTGEVLIYLERAIEHRRLQLAQKHLWREAQNRYTYASMVGRSPSMRRIFDLIERIGDSTASVLITGDSGTGKELIARAIHYQGARAKGPFIPVNCAAIPATLLESELFGYEKGAFTGANRPRPGLAVEASGGTLFLDEIGDMPLDLQPKILRLVQESELRPVGSDTNRKVDVRVVAATNADIANQVEHGRFRKDLYYRLNVVPIEVPPLNERPEDIPILAERLLHRVRDNNPRLAAIQLAPEAIDALMRYDWPGNVRELENVIERAATLCTGDVVTSQELRFLVKRAAPQTLSPVGEELPTLREMEARYIARVLESVGGSRVKAAAILGIDPSTLYRRTKHKSNRGGEQT